MAEMSSAEPVEHGNASEQKDYLLASKKSRNETHRQHSWWKSAGKNGISIIFLGTIIILGTMCFLTLFWIWSMKSMRDGQSRSFWRWMVKGGWAPQAVTLSSLTIRIAVSAQAGLCTSMLASTILEKFSARSIDVPAISMMRNVNTGPHNLALPIIRTLGSAASRNILALICLLSITTLASQFSSTILLSDFGTGTVSGDSTWNNVPYAMTKNYTWDNYTGTHIDHRGIDYWKSRPSGYPAFAEYSEAPYQHEMVGDTGLSIRGYLPYGVQADRISLQNFTGTTTLINSRFTCVRPSLNAQVHQSSENVFLYGLIYWDEPLPMLRLEDQHYKFNCSIPLEAASSNMRSSLEWKTSLCYITHNQEPGNYSLTPGMVSDLSGGTIETQVYIILNATGTSAQWLNHFETNGTWTFSADREWSILHTDDPGVQLAVSLCFTNLESNYYHVEIFSKTQRKEPILSFRNDSNSYFTEDIRKQLGTIGALIPPDDRGVLFLKPTINWTDDVDSANVGVKRVSDLSGGALSGLATEDNVYEHRDNYWEGNMKLDACAIMCLFCDVPDFGASVHRAHSILFQDVLTSTRSPALALQALFTSLTQAVYYDSITEFSVTAAAESAFFVEVLLPVHWKGFAAVASILFVHLLCVSLISVLFFTTSRWSLLGNSWHVISQILSGDIENILEKASAMTDEEVEAELAKNGMQRVEYALAQSADIGKVEVVRRRANVRGSDFGL